MEEEVHGIRASTWVRGTPFKSFTSWRNLVLFRCFAQRAHHPQIWYTTLSPPKDIAYSRADDIFFQCSCNVLGLCNTLWFLMNKFLACMTPKEIIQFIEIRASACPGSLSIVRNNAFPKFTAEKCHDCLFCMASSPILGPPEVMVSNHSLDCRPDDVLEHGKTVPAIYHWTVYAVIFCFFLSGIMRLGA